MKSAAFSIFTPSNADLILAAHGLFSKGGDEFSAADQAVLRRAAAKMLASAQQDWWNDEVIDAVDNARDTVNSVRPDWWPDVPAHLTGGETRLDLSLPVLWAACAIGTTVAHTLVADPAHTSVADPWKGIGRLIQQAGTRLAGLRRACGDGVDPGDLPDLGPACASLLRCLARWGLVVFVIPDTPGCENAPSSRRSPALADARAISAAADA